jgi:hypothetical protein
VRSDLGFREFADGAAEVNLVGCVLEVHQEYSRLAEAGYQPAAG